LAGRYAHFSDFGGATVGKLTARYDFGPMFALRGTIANGFRAPTLAEEYYTGTNVSPSSAAVQLAPNSTPATIAGFGPLKPEKSTNYSIGFVAHPMDKMQITLDLYRINITDRVINTGFIYGSFNGTTISTAVNNAITAHGNTLDPGISYSGINVFTNAADTRTDGAELTINYASDFGDLGHVDWSVAGNYNATVITKEAPLPAADFFNGGALLPSNLKILSSSAETALTTAVPKEKVILGAFWSLSNWSVNLRETVYGPASQLFTQSTITTKLSTSTTPITDLDVSYKLPKGFKIAIGANNLFDKKAPVVPNNANGRPADGGNVYYHPVGFTPWGINGGYYYTRLTLSF
jgi:iron complex outermembrane receptor protein